MGAVAGVTGSSNEQPHTNTHRGDRHRSVGASLCQSLILWAVPGTAVQPYVWNTRQNRRSELAVSCFKTAPFVSETLPW